MKIGTTGKLIFSKLTNGLEITTTAMQNNEPRGGLILHTYVTISLELAVGFLALFTFTKIMGKSHFSQLTPFDFISVIILGELLGNAVYDDEVSIWQVLFATTLWAMLIYSFMFITQKVKKIRKTLEGEPSILIHRGKMEYTVMKKNRLDINQLQSMVRQQGYLSISEVEHAFLETNGALSVFPKPEYGTPTKKDLQLKLESPPIPVTLIIDGELVDDNLKEAGVDRSWLDIQLHKENIQSYTDVLFAEMQNKQELYVQKR